MIHSLCRPGLETVDGASWTRIQKMDQRCGCFHRENMEHIWKNYGTNMEDMMMTLKWVSQFWNWEGIRSLAPCFSHPCHPQLETEAKIWRCAGRHGNEKVGTETPQVAWHCSAFFFPCALRDVDHIPFRPRDVVFDRVRKDWGPFGKGKNVTIAVQGSDVQRPTSTRQFKRQQPCNKCWREGKSRYCDISNQKHFHIVERSLSKLRRSGSLLQAVSLIDMEDKEKLEPDQTQDWTWRLEGKWLEACYSTWYPLVNVYIAMENHHFQWENPLEITIFNGKIHCKSPFFPMDFLHRFPVLRTRPVYRSEPWRLGHDKWLWRWLRRGKRGIFFGRVSYKFLGIYMGFIWIYTDLWWLMEHFWGFIWGCIGDCSW